MLTPPSSYNEMFPLHGLNSTLQKNILEARCLSYHGDEYRYD